jgi:hypothetical protein
VLGDARLVKLPLSPVLHGDWARNRLRPRLMGIDEYLPDLFGQPLILPNPRTDAPFRGNFE